MKSTQKSKSKELKVVYEMAANVSKEESEHRMHRVFDILFDETLRRINAEKSDKA